MPVPDPHANEPTVEVHRDTWKLYQEATDAVVAWTKERDRLKVQLQDELGDAYAATVDGKKVATFRPQDNWATAALRKDYPDLTDHFMRHRVHVELDVEAFAAQHPDIAEKYRVRSFRSVK